MGTMGTDFRNRLRDGASELKGAAVDEQTSYGQPDYVWPGFDATPIPSEELEEYLEDHPDDPDGLDFVEWTFQRDGLDFLA